MLNYLPAQIGVPKMTFHNCHNHESWLQSFESDWWMHFEYTSKPKLCKRIICSLTFLSIVFELLSLIRVLLYLIFFDDVFKKLNASWGPKLKMKKRRNPDPQRNIIPFITQPFLKCLFVSRILRVVDVFLIRTFLLIQLSLYIWRKN